MIRGGIAEAAEAMQGLRDKFEETLRTTREFQERMAIQVASFWQGFPEIEKESEPAELTPTPKKRIGFRFED